MPDITVDAHVDSFMANTMNASNKTTLKARLEAENAGAAAAAQAAAEATAAAELSNAGIDTTFRALYDSSANLSVAWSDRYLYDAGGGLMLDWSGSMVPVPQFPNGLLAGGNGYYGSVQINDGYSTSIHLDSYGIYDSSFNPSVDAQYRALYDYGYNPVLDWGVSTNGYNSVYCYTDIQVGGTAILGSAVIAFDISDSSYVTSLSNSARLLHDSSGTQVFDWSDSAKMVASVPIQFPTDGFIMQSPDATLWAVTIDNSGVISTASLP